LERRDARAADALKLAPEDAGILAGVEDHPERAKIGQISSLDASAVVTVVHVELRVLVNSDNAYDREPGSIKILGCRGNKLALCN
jgi:hypothetical protein